MSMPNELKINSTDQIFIKEAIHFLERPNLLVQLTNFFGKPIELAQKALPKAIEKQITLSTHKALYKGLSWSVATLKNSKSSPPIRSQSYIHTTGVGITGALGGLFGWPGLLVELPLSTMIMLRSIASIAQDAGEDIHSAEVQLECLQIFAMGSQRSRQDDEMESAYYIQRLGLAHMIQQASQYIGRHSAKEVLAAIEKQSAPALVKLLTRIASEFEVVVTEKMLAESVPVIGAIGGAAINTAFISYFNKIASYHFGLKKSDGNRV